MGGAEQQNTRADIAPDWALWLDLLAINVSQAAALSLNLDPARADKAPSLALRQELQRRSLVIENHANNGGFKITGRDFDRRAKTRQPRLPLHDFVLWALARSWALPEPLARKFAPPAAPALPEGHAMPPDLLSISEWARRLACVECPVPPRPKTEAKQTIAYVVAWCANGPGAGLFRLVPKPGTVWLALADVREWDEEPITNAVEAQGFSGYISQAATGHPPYPSPPLILNGRLQVFTVKTQLDPEWDDYNDASSAYGITRLWWEEQLIRAVNTGAVRACDAARAVITHQSVQPHRAYVNRQALAVWITEHQPFKDVGAAFNDRQVAAPRANEPPQIAAQDPKAPTLALAEQHDNTPECEPLTSGMVTWTAFLLRHFDHVVNLTRVKGEGVQRVINFLESEGAKFGITASDSDKYAIRYRDRDGCAQYVTRKYISNWISEQKKIRGVAKDTT